MRDRQICIDCGKASPETETNYTLISAQFGWRLSRRRADSGEFIVEWRCAECWREHKKKTQAQDPPVPPKPAPSKAQLGPLPPPSNRPGPPSTPPPAGARRTSSKPPAPPTGRSRRT